MARDGVYRAWPDGAMCIACKVNRWIAYTQASIIQDLRAVESTKEDDSSMRKMIAETCDSLEMIADISHSIESRLHLAILEELGLVGVIKRDMHGLQQDLRCPIRVRTDYSVALLQRVNWPYTKFST